MAEYFGRANLCQLHATLMKTYIHILYYTYYIRTYVAETSCSQLLLIDSGTCMLIKLNLPVINVIAMSLYNVAVAVCY